MTREEEIEKAAAKFDGSMDCVGCFIGGVKWADEHPRKGLVDIEKVCEWLEEKIDDYLYINIDWHTPQLEATLYEDLKKAMEGE